MAVCGAALAAGCDDEGNSHSKGAPSTAPSTQPATQPATQPTTSAADEPKVLTQYTDLLLEDDPDFPTTQPLPAALALEEAARLVFDEPLFLDAVGCLWLTHPRGQTPEQVVGGELMRQTFVVNEPVVFTWWKTGYRGRPTVEMILQREDGGYDWLHELGRAQVPAPPDGRSHDWSRAFVYYKSIVVPSDGGVAVLTPVDRPDPAEYFRRYGRREEDRRPDGTGRVEIKHIALAEPRENLPATQIRLDGRGLIAWVPWISKRITGGEKIGRFFDNEWAELSGDGWTTRPVHLMPLSDGSILQLSIDEKGDSQLSAVPLNTMPVEREAVAQLIADLSSTDPQQREAAFVALTNYGPGAWPTLEDLLPDQPPVVQKQMNVLLGDKTNPSFGGLMPESGPVEVREWLADGGVILRFRNGILLPDGAGVTVLERPAWLLIRPGRRIALLDPMVVSEISASDDVHAYVWGDEWIICRPGQGAQRWLINHIEPVLEDEHAEWQHFVGMDQVGRWLFRRPGESTPTLLLDIRIPDPAPRLPTWVIQTGTLGEAGFDADGWPVSKSGGAWRLKEENWESLEEEEEFTSVSAVLPQEVLATAPDGSTYRGGVDRIQWTSADGETIDWALPASVVGSGSAKAAVDREGRLFLFNRPGSIVRLARTAGAAEPFKVEAIFEEQDLPAATPQHVWLDPAGRICAIYFGNTVAVMWPDGRVPASIRQKMPAKRRDRPPEDPFRRI